MSTIVNPSPTGGGGSTNMGAIDVVLPGMSDEVLGVVTGLSGTPTKVVGEVLYEEGVTVQSGLAYSFNAYKLNASGFNFRVKVLNNEFWPGSAPVTLKVNYAWSSS